MAIILDDFGWGVPGTEEAIAIEAPITFSVLPWGPYSALEAGRARAAGHEVMLHLPMEALTKGDGDADVIPGTIMTGMSPEEVEDHVRKALEAVGPVAGLNNHTGSKATADKAITSVVASIAKDLGIYVVDSRTTAESVLLSTAREMGVPSAANQGFLDNEKDEAYVRDRLVAAAALAKKRAVIVIGHVHPVTVKCIVDMIPEFREMGVTLVKASSVVYSGD